MSPSGIPSRALLLSSVFVTALLFLLGAPTSSHADAVMPPPENCPDGSRGASGHGGPHCRPLDCASTADCREGTCEMAELCIEKMQQGGGWGEPFLVNAVVGTCPNNGPCYVGTCQVGRVCLSQTAGDPSSSDPGGQPVNSCSSSTGAPVLGWALVALLLLRRRNRRQRLVAA